jgi:hypothetical protein
MSERVDLCGYERRERERTGGIIMEEGKTIVENEFDKNKNCVGWRLGRLLCMWLIWKVCTSGLNKIFAE